MDEPLSDIDAKLRDQMRGEISRIQRALGVTTLYVTHDQIEAMTLGDVVAVMEEGVVRQIGTPKEIYEHPVDVFVAAFMGTPPMNLAEATLEAADGRGELRFGSHRVGIDASGLPATAGSRQVILGIRPEHLRVARPGDDPDAVVRVRVDRREHVGAATFLRFRVDAPLLMVRDPRDAVVPDADEEWAAERANTFVARADAEDETPEGEAVDVFVDTSRVHLFDPSSELTIR
jgi:multiple sugar transport system ATP-binding protein